MWTATTVRRRLGIPRRDPLLAWARGDYRGMQVPGPPMEPVRYWPPVLALGPDCLWLSKAGAVRRFALDDIVLVSTATRPRGALRVDFMSGGPLVVLIDDDGTFRDRLSSEIRRRDAGAEPAAAAAPAFPELPAESFAEAAELRHGARRLLARAGDDLQVRVEAEKLLDAAHDVVHEAQVAALRAQRAEVTGPVRGMLPAGRSGVGAGVPSGRGVAGCDGPAPGHPCRDVGGHVANASGRRGLPRSPLS